MKADARLNFARATLSAAKNVSDDLPLGTRLFDCSIGALHIALTFSGGVLDPVANEIASILESVIAEQIRRVVCSELAQLVEKNLTNIIQTQVNPQLRNIIRSTATQYTPPPANLNRQERLLDLRVVLGTLQVEAAVRSAKQLTQ
jgi:hypothetical protein